MTGVPSQVAVPLLLLTCEGRVCRDKIVDFHWNACDPWTIVSVSDDCESAQGGGTLQVFCLAD